MDSHSKERHVLVSFAYRYLKYRTRTVWEMRRYLEKKVTLYRFNPQLVDQTIDYLTSLHLLDDLVFIGEYVRTQNTIKPKGVRALRAGLKKYGIQDTDIDTYFMNKQQDESELALRALRLKMKSLIHIGDETKRYQKAIQFMQRRGFSYDSAKEAYKKLTQEPHVAN